MSGDDERSARVRVSRASAVGNRSKDECGLSTL